MQSVVMASCFWKFDASQGSPRWDGKGYLVDMSGIHILCGTVVHEMEWTIALKDGSV